MKNAVYFPPLLWAFCLLLLFAAPIQADDSSDEPSEELFVTTGLPNYRIPAITCTRKGTLVAAVVKATSSNGGEGTFAITGEKGTFELTLSRPGKYTLEFSYLGYKTFSKDYNIRPGQANNIGRIKMEEDAVALKEAQVIGKNMRVKQTADTTIINADGYKVMEGASAEDLIAKMPGMRITDWIGTMAWALTSVFGATSTTTEPSGLALMPYWVWSSSSRACLSPFRWTIVLA